MKMMCLSEAETRPVPVQNSGWLLNLLCNEIGKGGLFKGAVLVRV